MAEDKPATIGRHRFLDHATALVQRRDGRLGQARDWDREEVLSMLTGKDDLKGEDLPARLTEDGVSAYIDKLFAQHESKNHT